MEKRKIESQPLINLSLGIGNEYQKDRNVKVEVDDHGFDQRVMSLGCRNCLVVRFTDDQIKELELQLNIFRYIGWGLPVPNNLLVLIWRSLSPSFTLSSCPLWVGISSQGTYHKNIMDVEPGRCKRNDGKKWRCRQSALPYEKYCQKHLNRGTYRSRKLVEAVNRYLPKSEVVIKAPSLTDIVAKRDEKVEASNDRKHDMVEKERIADINLGSGLEYSTKGVHQDDHRCPEAERQMRPPQPVPERASRSDSRKRQHFNRGLNNPSISPSTPKWAYRKHAKTGMGLGLGIDLNIPLSTTLDDPRPDIRDSSTGNSCTSTDTTTSDDSAYISNLIDVSPRLQ